MRVLPIKELTRLTRVQLIDLYVRITNALPDMPEGSESRQIALINLRNIRIVLARHDLTPWQQATPCRFTPAGFLRLCEGDSFNHFVGLASRRHDLQSVVQKGPLKPQSIPDRRGEPCLR